MPSFSLPPAIVAAILTVVATAFATLIGIVYRKITGRLDEHESTLDAQQSAISSIEERTTTLFSWAFGSEANDADKGISADVEEGFENIVDRIDELEERQAENHAEVRDKLDQLVTELHHEENVAIDRDDIE